MNFFILPNNRTHQHVDVRLRDAQPYDGLDFVGYPERQGWIARPAGQWLQEFQTPSTGFLAMLERWLLFGPICGSYGSVSVPSDFIRIRNRVPYPFFDIQRVWEINSAKAIPMSIDSFKAIACGYQLNSTLIKREDQDFPINRSRKLCSLFDFICFNGGYFDDPRNPAVSLATSAIIETLILLSESIQRAFSTLAKDQCPPFTPKSLGDWHGLIWAKMRCDGWCPSELTRLFDGFNTACLYFLCNLRRPGPHETHQMIRIHRLSVLRQAPPRIASDKMCTAFECTHRTLQEDKYKTQHTIGCGGCDDVVSCLDTLQGIIKRGKIPLIRSIEENHDGPEIIFVESEPRQPDHSYVSISHIWSDGLGNLERNALPQCQLRRISRLIRRLPGEQAEIPLFWCDTLCVPPDTAGIPDVQALAMGQMRDIYADATSVLVLDSWIFTSKMSTASPEEILLKIFCCTWNTRLWTYQEGVLAKSLYFQFIDGPFDLDAGFREACRSATPTSKLTIIPALEKQYHALRGFREYTTIHSRLGAIASALGHRVTSVAADEPLCLAVLLDLDVVKLTETEPAERMAVFWKMLPTVVTSAVFMNRTAKLAIDGLRWAPATFLRSPRNITGAGAPAPADYYNSKPLHRDDKGVKAECRVTRFFTWRCPFTDKIRLRDENKQWTEWQFELRNAHGSLSIPKRPAGQVTPRLNPADMLGCNEVAILEENLINPVLTHIDSLALRIGILVSIDKEEEGVIYCRSITSCHTNMVSSSLVHTLSQCVPERWAYGDALVGDKISGCALAAPAKLTSQWCCIG